MAEEKTESMAAENEAAGKLDAESSAAGSPAADDFESAFAEFSKARDVRAEESEAAGEPDAGDHSAEQKAEEKTPPSKEGEPPEGDDLAKRLEAAESRAREFEQRYRSDLGRQAKLQRQILELQEKLKTAHEGENSGRPKSAKMKQLSTEFPEVAQALQEELESLKSEFQSAVTPLKEVNERRELDTAESEVRKVYPEFVATVKSPEFVEWFEKQPVPVQALAGSRDPRDAIAMLDYYNGGRKTSPEPKPDSKITDIQSRRDAALQRNVSVRDKSAPPISAAPDDFENSFAYFAKRRERQASQRL
jgi:predicted transcriptional regulator